MARQQDLFSWGGKRRGAGRPPGPRPVVQRAARPSHSRHHPVHVTLRVREGLPSLRSASLSAALCAVFAAGRDRMGLRLVHYCLQKDHIHLLVEAQDRRALSRGLQGLMIRMAKAVHRAVGTAGKVFADRYHAHVLRTPKETRHALCYVLNNHQRHLAKQGHVAPKGFVDPHSSACFFDGWRERVALPAAQTDRPVVEPETWLLRLGWRRHGRIGIDEIPGERASRRRPAAGGRS